MRTDIVTLQRVAVSSCDSELLKEQGALNTLNEVSISRTDVRWHLNTQGHIPKRNQQRLQKRSQQIDEEVNSSYKVSTMGRGHLSDPSG
ncbi:hypothetical protein NDU88_002131 [Pleurodeles waltl]|uniref:Uncharacterized protein n=1 Tax=Pleurodeles waltl TaxID=8319 RepID=A0AAV7MMY4_PLEWA|nr:hypothetical protein NDU88_002131 [Pleurodeles waltl]